MFSVLERKTACLLTFFHSSLFITPSSLLSTYIYRMRITYYISFVGHGKVKFFGVKAQNKVSLYSH